MFSHVHRSLNVATIGTYSLWGGRRLESAGTHQEGVRLGFGVLHLGVVSQDDVVKQSEEVFVAAGLQTERSTG